MAEAARQGHKVPIGAESREKQGHKVPVGAESRRETGVGTPTGLPGGAGRYAP